MHMESDLIKAVRRSTMMNYQHNIGTIWNLRWLRRVGRKKPISFLKTKVAIVIREYSNRRQRHRSLLGMLLLTQLIIFCWHCSPCSTGSFPYHKCGNTVWFWLKGRRASSDVSGWAFINSWAITFNIKKYSFSRLSVPLGAVEVGGKSYYLSLVILVVALVKLVLSIGWIQCLHVVEWFKIAETWIQAWTK
jgi:hypothetical protein